MFRSDDSITVRSIAPEDVVRGMHIVILRSRYEYPSFLWCADNWQIPTDEVVCVSTLPDQPMPLRVRGVALPFVLIRSATGEVELIDLRRHSIAQLPEPFGERAYQMLRKSFKKSAKKSH